MTIGYFSTVNQDDKWQYTNIAVTHDITPFYQLLTGGRYGCFILTTPKYRCHWGRFLHSKYAHFDGIYLIKNPMMTGSDDMPISPITSADIERFKQYHDNNDMAYWANFYADELLKNPTSVLSKGHWKIVRGIHKNDRPFVLEFRAEMAFYHDDLLTIDFNQTVCHFDWGGFPFDSVISLNPLPDECYGRVRWWRKKIKENACPPLLFWWQQHSQSLLLIDGHARLKAYQLENQKPNYLVLTAYHDVRLPVDSTEQIKNRLKALQGIKKSLADGKRNITLAEFNHLVLQLYEDHSYHKTTTPPKVVGNLDEIFEQDLLDLSNHLLDNEIKEAIKILLTNNQN
ncbi:MAG: hypothetical protein Q3971_06485 [Moraxella sp.]|nr:hypothetical protein [Moraxella sp.]